MRTGPTNEHLQSLIATLKRESHAQKSGLWAAIARNLESSTRQRRIVNLSRINRNTAKNEVIVVPGKVLGSGVLDHSVTVAAWSFSDSAKEMIAKANGSCITIPELIKKDPKGKNVKIIG